MPRKERFPDWSHDLDRAVVDFRDLGHEELAQEGRGGAREDDGRRARLHGLLKREHLDDHGADDVAVVELVGRQAVAALDYGLGVVQGDDDVAAARGYVLHAARHDLPDLAGVVGYDRLAFRFAELAENGLAGGLDADAPQAARGDLDLEDEARCRVGADAARLCRSLQLFLVLMPKLA